MHFGLLPRANRGIFAINELPDLSGKVQVGLFNIMQEGDVQIKGYPVRLPLDVLLAFTANPEDYTARGKIITPLKDRIGSEVITHYPRTVQLGMEITAQEAWIDARRAAARHPRLRARGDRAGGVRGARGQAGGQALGREPAAADQRAGERGLQRRAARDAAAARSGSCPRVSDVYAAVPSITGKLELEYEGELQGGDTIARELIRRAAGKVLEERMGGADLGKIVAWFDQGGALKVPGDERAELCFKGFAWCPGWSTPVADVRALAPRATTPRAVAACELVLEGLAAQKRISRSEELGYTRVKPERREPGYGKGGISFG